MGSSLRQSLEHRRKQARAGDAVEDAQKASGHRNCLGRRQLPHVWLLAGCTLHNSREDNNHVDTRHSADAEANSQAPQHSQLLALPSGPSPAVGRSVLMALQEFRSLQSHSGVKDLEETDGVSFADFLHSS